MNNVSQTSFSFIYNVLVNLSVYIPNAFQHVIINLQITNVLYVLD